MRPARHSPLNAEYHDAAAEAVEVGPRREVILTVRLDPVWNNGDGSTRRLHFSAIENFYEVAAFFRRAPAAREDGGSVDEVAEVALVSEGAIRVELARLGRVEIRGAKVREY